MNLYESHYTQLNFERAGLFKLICDNYRSRDVLYPGCSVHITPSLYFPHVVYVDQSKAAAQFFADEKYVSGFVSRNKHYRLSSYIRFIRQDYTTPLPLRDGTFDLLLSLFAGGIARSCTRYLKVGGLLLTNNHQGDALDAIHDHNLKSKAIVRFQRGKYVIVENALDERKIPTQRMNSRYLKQVNQGVEYVENELYYVFERRHAQKRKIIKSAE